MNIPGPGLTEGQVNRAISRHCAERYQVVQDELHCKSCDSRIEATRGTASVCFGTHGDGPCGGGGDVEGFILPFCPQCEGKPTETSTCIHTHPMRQSDEFGDTSRFPDSDGKGGFTRETMAFSLSREYDGP